jgi:hypothetical protein
MNMQIAAGAAGMVAVPFLIAGYLYVKQPGHTTLRECWVDAAKTAKTDKGVEVLIAVCQKTYPDKEL